MNLATKEIPKYLTDKEYKLVVEIHPKYFLTTDKLKNKLKEDETNHRVKAKESRHDLHKYYKREIRRFYERHGLQQVKLPTDRIAFKNTESLNILPLKNEWNYKSKKEILEEIMSKGSLEQDHLLGKSILKKYGKKDGMYQIPGQYPTNASSILGETKSGL
mmetsp:Transcript_25340/g.22453  ORF Transcript_25340/g.22453 Transcript_25340/m.22453 type:complete len:161 (+) Transcript_25340:888-1370(+)